MNMRCSSDLAELILEDNWLNSSIVNEAALAEITRQSKNDLFCFLDSSLYGDVVDSSRSGPLVGYLQRAQAETKKRMLIIINTNLQLGIHWILGYIKFDEKTILICDSMIHQERNYEYIFRNLFKLVKLVLQLKQMKTDINQWKFVILTDLDQQPNSWDCGVYVCLYIKQILAQKSLKNCDCLKEREYVRALLNVPYGEYILPGPRRCTKDVSNEKYDEIINDFSTFKIILGCSENYLNN